MFIFCFLVSVLAGQMQITVTPSCTLSLFGMLVWQRTVVDSNLCSYCGNLCDRQQSMPGL